jgi:putative transposase
MSVAEKRNCIQADHTDLSIRRQCELIGLPRSSYYRETILVRGEHPYNLELMRLIDEEYTRHPFYGSRQIRNYLRKNGHKVNRKRVQRLMQKMGIQSVAPKPGTSQRHPDHKVYPYLLRDLVINRPDQVHCSDITYIRMPGGFVYLTAVMDWHSRFVLSWEVSVSMEAEFCVSALERSLRLYGAPEIFNTDQGSQYTGKEFTDTLKEHGVKISMDGKGRAMDNIMIERLWRSVKYEEIYLKEYDSVADLKRALKLYFDFYNYERSHSSLDGKTPADVYFEEQELKKVIGW